MPKHDDLPPKPPVPAPPRRVPIQRRTSPDIWSVQDDFWVDNRKWSKERLGAAVMNYTRFCRCGACNSCQVGEALLSEASRRSKIF